MVKLQKKMEEVLQHHMTATDSVPATLGAPKQLSNEQRNEVYIERTQNTVSTIHTHWNPNGNLTFSRADYNNETPRIISIFLINRNFEFIKSVRCTGFDVAVCNNGFSKGIKVF